MRIRPSIAALTTAAAVLYPDKAFGSELDHGLSGADNAPPDIPGSMDALGSAIWVIVALIIVIILIVLSLRWLSSRSRTWGASRAIRSLGGVALGQNKSLQAVEIGGRLYIVGVGDDVTLIDRIDDVEEAGRIIDLLDNPTAQSMQVPLLGEWLNRLRGGRRDIQDGGEWSASDFEVMLQSSLERQAGRKQQIESLVNGSQSKDRLRDE